jgi:hypothetical protein
MGQVFSGPIRTRSVLAKRAVAKALGYPAPASFRRVRPRFPGQNLDVAVQTADNFQIWNEEVDPLRRYAFLRPTADGTLVAVRVVTGEVIAALDTTGTLTAKYQASRQGDRTGSLLVTPVDTVKLVPLLGNPAALHFGMSESTADVPHPGRVLPIAEVFERMLRLIGSELEDPGSEQDRARGEALQRAAAEALDVGRYDNFGQWPDFRSQALEIKLQMARTIDLGLILPSSTEPAEMLGAGIRHCDVRYAVVYGSPTEKGTVRVDSVVVTTGEGFFSEFRQFGGLAINKKLQIKLPRGFFEAE